MTYSLKSFEKEDLPWVMTLEERSFAGDSFPQSLFEDLLAQPSILGIIVTKQGENVGYILVRCSFKEAEILTIAVEEKGQGVGSFLLGNTLASLLAMDIEDVFLEVRPSNTPAIKLYEKFGAEKVGERPNYYEDEDAHVYRLKLGEN